MQPKQNYAHDHIIETATRRSISTLTTSILPPKRQLSVTIKEHRVLQEVVSPKTQKDLKFHFCAVLIYLVVGIKNE